MRNLLFILIVLIASPAQAYDFGDGYGTGGSERSGEASAGGFVATEDLRDQLADLEETRDDLISEIAELSDEASDPEMDQDKRDGITEEINSMRAEVSSLDSEISALAALVAYQSQFYYYE